MQNSQCIAVPDVLTGGVEAVEILLSALSRVEADRSAILDLDDVRFVYPYGAALLFSACRHVARLTGTPVQLRSLRQDVHAYLRRIDFFREPAAVAYSLDTFDEANDLGRSTASSNVLELVTIATPSDVYSVSNRARRILDYWLHGVSHDIDQIVTMIAETCSNVIDHSQDCGVVTIQKYDYGAYAEVKLAICDLGVGIRGSLSAVHPGLRDSCAGYIKRALSGLSARVTNRGGQGLGAILRIMQANAGDLCIRSETGLVRLGTQGGILAQDNLIPFPGTQIAITFRSSA